MLLLCFMAVFMTIVKYIQALPLNVTSSDSGDPVNRAYPYITPGLYSEDQEAQIHKAHHDAIQLASTVVSNQKRFNEVGPMYFDSPDHPIALNLFKQIIGLDDGLGNDILSQLQFVADWEKPDNGGLSCGLEGRVAELRRDDPSAPKIVLCPSAFSYGAISDDFDGAEGVTCDNIDSRVSWKMKTFGYALLHEYFHFDELTSPVVSQPFPDGFGLSATPRITDHAYGAYKARYISKDLARENADSYAWLANEIFWKQTCEDNPFTENDGPIGEPEKGDDGSDTELKA